MANNELDKELPRLVRADVQMQRSGVVSPQDQALWSAIRNRTNALGFNQYSAFINRLLCEKRDRGTATCAKPSTTGDSEPSISRTDDGPTASDIGAPSIKETLDDIEHRPAIYGVDAYQLLKIATQAFLLFEAGIVVKGTRHPGHGQFSVLTSEGKFKVQEPTDTVPGEESRRGESVTFEELEAELNSYLGQTVGPITGRSLPYLKRILQTLVPSGSRSEKLPYCEEILQRRLSCPSMLELIWSYWQEEGMLAQTMNSITLRFQNQRRGSHDPLANFELDPLRPLNHLLWGFIQDEQNRLTVPRRVYEYDHHYGMTLYGKAVANFQPADSRSKFIRAFHDLLYRASVFYREDSDTTVISDGFPLLNALKEVHLILAEGAHNQFGDLPWTARAEMLMTQWFLARPEMREFLRGRYMVPYQEPWMGAVDSMKKLQGWTDTTVSHFRDLAVFGEQIILSVRYGDWVDVYDQEVARSWARYWRPEIQSYLHSYLAVAGVDLTSDVIDTRQAGDRYLQPSVHLRNRLSDQRTSRSFPGGDVTVEVLGSSSERSRQVSGVRRRLLSRNNEPSL